MCVWDGGGGSWEDPGYAGVTIVALLAWEELEEVSGEKEAWASLLRQLPLRPGPR